jgi:ABC-type glycerol-3-phosphate transport system permease component
MNALHWLLLTLAGIFVVLFIIGARRAAFAYARVTTLLIVGTVMLMPFAWLICAAFKDKNVLNEYAFLPPPATWFDKNARVGGKVVPLNSLPDDVKPAPSDVLPPTLNLGNFRTLLEHKPTLQGPVNFWKYVTNSLFLAAAGTFLSLVFSSMSGYALAKYRFRGRVPIIIFMLASLTIPGVVLLAPNFEVIWRLGWMDTFKALLIPGAVSVFGIFLFRQSILGVPDDILEAGRIDGCGEFRIYLTLVMPLVRPVIGAFCLISFLGIWNSFITPNIFLQSQDKLPLPVVLNQYIGEYSQQYGVFLAGTLLAIIPPAVLFFALQREFIAGLTTGAVKQ